MKMKPFGARETTWSEQSLAELIGHIGTLITNEDERTETRKRGGALDVRMDLVCKAHELLQVAEDKDLKIMKQSLAELCTMP